MFWFFLNCRVLELSYSTCIVINGEIAVDSRYNDGNFPAIWENVRKTTSQSAQFEAMVAVKELIDYRLFPCISIASIKNNIFPSVDRNMFFPAIFLSAAS